MTEHTSVVTVIGAGFSAVALSTQLLRRGIPVRVIGPAQDFARGLAYGGAHPGHLLNVPAERMGLDPAQPGAFADHLQLHGASRRAYVPRVAYGDYLHGHWRALREAHPGLVEAIEATVTQVHAHEAGFDITLDDGRVLPAQRLVLALGTAPLPPVEATPAHVISDPWRSDAFAHIATHDDVLVLGSSLTMMDVVSSLLRGGHRGRITALSRRGLLPRMHPEPPLPPLPPSDALLQTLQTGNLSRALQLFREAVEEGASPDALADGLRAHVTTLWRAWPDATRSRFLRHLRPWWDRVRHRAPVEVSDVLKGARQQGRFNVRAGRLLAHDGVSASVRWRGVANPETLPVRWIVDATGWDRDAARFTRHPVLCGMIESGAVSLDPHGLGLVCDAQGRVFGRQGMTANLYVIGSLRRGECWESSAVPELRVQAEALAEQLAAG